MAATLEIFLHLPHLMSKSNASVLGQRKPWAGDLTAPWQTCPLVARYEEEPAVPVEKCTLQWQREGMDNQELTVACSLPFCPWISDGPSFRAAVWWGTQRWVPKSRPYSQRGHLPEQDVPSPQLEKREREGDLTIPTKSFSPAISCSNPQHFLFKRKALSRSLSEPATKVTVAELKAARLTAKQKDVERVRVKAVP